MSVGVGTPSDTHLSVTVWLIQDLSVDEDASFIVGGSEKLILRIGHALLLLYCTTKSTVCDGLTEPNYVVSKENCRVASEGR